jgi:NADH-quinone oxidoreductase subunit E
MSNRRLAPDNVQPASFAFNAANAAWAALQIAKFPSDRQASAVIPLLMRAQEQHQNWLPRAAIEYVAKMLSMPFIRVFEVATFYTQYQLSPVGLKAHVQVCGTTPCMLRGSEELIKICQSRIHHDAFHLSNDGNFSWEEVECAGACVNAPMVQIFSDTYEDLTPASFNALLDGFDKGTPPKPGPQNGRTGGEPMGGLTSLKDAK